MIGMVAAEVVETQELTAQICRDVPLLRELAEEYNILLAAEDARYREEHGGEPTRDENGPTAAWTEHIDRQIAIFRAYRREVSELRKQRIMHDAGLASPEAGT